MEKIVYEEKLKRWMAFAKQVRMRKVEAWPFWLQFVRSFGIDPAPVHFWRPFYIWLYYFISIIGSWIAVVYIFTRTLEDIVKQNNLIALFGIALSFSVLLTWNIIRKKKKYNLTTFEEF